METQKKERIMVGIILNGFTFGTGNGGPANFRAINGGQAYDGNAGGSICNNNDFVELEIKKLSNQFLNFHYNDSNVDGTAVLLFKYR